MNRLVYPNVWLSSSRLSVERFSASWWSSCCSKSFSTLKIELWQFKLSPALLAEMFFVFPLCFSSSLQYVKVTIWCESQSAALLWILTSAARHAQQAACDLKRPIQKPRKWCVQVISALRTRSRSTGWHDFREKEKAGERNVLNQVCMPDQGRVTCDEGSNTRARTHGTSYATPFKTV